MARWAIPFFTVVALAIFFAIIFLPFGILFGLIALVMLGYRVLYREEPRNA